jgi:hypothetical protein
MFLSQAQKTIASITFFRQTSFSGNSHPGEEIGEAAVQSNAMASDGPGILNKGCIRQMKMSCQSMSLPI